jgi:hypothetical protein
MACLNDFNYEILLSHCTLREGEEFIRSKYWETYYFEPGFMVLGLRTLGEGAIPVAIEDNTDDTVIFTFTKPCMGTFVLRIPGVPDEVKRVRTGYTKSLTLDRWTGSGGNRVAAEAITVRWTSRSGISATTSCPTSRLLKSAKNSSDLSTGRLITSPPNSGCLA